MRLSLVGMLDGPNGSDGGGFPICKRSRGDDLKARAIVDGVELARDHHSAGVLRVKVDDDRLDDPIERKFEGRRLIADDVLPANVSAEQVELGMLLSSHGDLRGGHWG